MKKLVLLLCMFLLFSPTAWAKQWDIGYVAKWDRCHMIKYRCDIWSDFYSDNIGCGCIQILSDSQMQKADEIIEKLVSKVHDLHQEKADQEVVLEKIQTRIEDKMFENKENSKFQILWRYLQTKIYNVHGNEF